MIREKSLVLIKPDGVSRRLIGEIIARIEKTGLDIVDMKMAEADWELAGNHYEITDEWCKGVFDKAKDSFESQGKEFPHSDYKEYGKMIQNWNMDFITEGRVLAMIIEGPHAVSVIRKIVGATDPSKAVPGTIRGDLLYESAALANEAGRSLRNLIHASGSVEEAEREIGLWFGD